MSEILVKYVMGASREALLKLTLEDLALCQAWYASYLDMDTVRENYQGLPERVAAWTSDKEDALRNSQGARQQPIIRHVLERLLTAGPEKLTRDELDFLFHSYELIQRTKSRNQFQRPLDLISPHLTAIEARRESLEVVRGLPAVLKLVGVVTEASILESPSRTMQAIGGIPELFSGPVFRHANVLKVVGDVPDRAVVVVEGEAVYVSGYVFGRVLVRGNAEIRENISGMVIAQHGNVRARSVVNRGTVVAKLGGVRLGSAEDPALIYAGRQLRIDGAARHGTYISPRIRVDGLLRGGECHIVSILRAQKMAGTDHKDLHIILRKELGSEDYGETVPKAARVLQRTAARLRNRIDHLQQMGAVQLEEAEHYANTALLYMCSGHQSQNELQVANSLRRRRAFLIRVLTGLQLLNASLLDRLKVLRERGETGRALTVMAELSVQSVLGEVSRELALLKGEGEYPEELDTEWNTLVALHTKSSGNESEGIISRAILRFTEARKAWRDELDMLEGRIAAMQDHLNEDATRKKLVERAQADGTSQPALAQIIKAARQRGPDDPVAKRVSSPFIKRMLTLLQIRNQWVERYRKEAGEQRQQLSEVEERLKKEFGVADPSERTEILITGEFESNVRIFLDEVHPLASGQERGTALAVPHTSGITQSYGIQDGVIVQLEGK